MSDTPASNAPIVMMSDMTLRDYFAAHAMGGLCADPTTNELSADEIATTAYRVADQLLAERDKPT